MVDYHVTYDQDTEQWRALKELAERAGSLHNTQDEAIDAAREYCVNQGGGRVHIHTKPTKENPQSLIRDVIEVQPKE